MDIWLWPEQAKVCINSCPRPNAKIIVVIMIKWLSTHALLRGTMANGSVANVCPLCSGTTHVGCGGTQLQADADH